jgi:uncharacterized repeat protein (TIGR01451 family)
MRGLALLLVLGSICAWALASPPRAAADGTCTNVSVTTLPAGTKDPNGAALSDPIGAWEQVSGQCTPAVSTVRVTVPDCQPGCGGSNHRSIVEWWAHAPSDCTLSQTTNPNDTLTCPGKADGRICIYIKKVPGPNDATAIATEPLHVTFPSGPPFDATPSLGATAPGCGPADHPANIDRPFITGVPTPGKTVTCDLGEWTPDTGLTPTFQWFKNGIPIPGETDSTYLVSPTDDGAEITCQVTMTNAEGDQASAISEPLEVSVPLPEELDCPGTNPPQPHPCADVSVQKLALRGFQGPAIHGDDKTAAVGEQIEFEVFVFNNGPDSSEPVEITETLPPGFVVDRIDALDCKNIGTAVVQLRCTFTNGANVGHVTGHFVKSGTWTNVVSVIGHVLDPNPNNNEARVTLRVTDPRATGAASTGPGGKVKASGSAGAAHGSAGPAAPPIAKVQVALLRKGKPGARIGKSGCSWLANARGKLRTVKPDASGKCSKGIWLQARGTRHWTFHAAHLPPGSYTLYIRAVDSGGATESLFSHARKNAIRLRVR